MKGSITKKLIGLLAGCLLIVIMLRWFEHSQVYHPSRVLDATGDCGGTASVKDQGGKKVHAGRWVSRSKYGVKRPKAAK